MAVMAITNKKNNEIIGFRCIIRDRTAEVENEVKLERAATHDVLTGLPNRNLFYDRLEQAISRNRQAGLHVAILFCDLDKFKQVNDTMGHHVGDEILRQAANRMKEVIRKTDTVARIGGNEFVFIIEGLNDTDIWIAVDTCCSKIISSVNKSYIISSGQVAHIGISIGVSIYPIHGKNADELIIRADQFMYQAKSSDNGPKWISEKI